MRLIDGFIPALAYGRELVAGQQADPEQARQQLVSLLEQARMAARRADFNDADYQDALFAVAAWLDESVMCSQWEGVEQWRRAPLQRQYFGTWRAGTDFFSRLSSLAPARRAVREVYYVMLCLGFRGKYSSPSDQAALNQIKQSQLDLLTGDPKTSAIDTGATLFPRAYPLAPSASARTRSAWWFSSTTIGMVVGPLAGVCVLYLVYHLILASLVHNIIH